MTNVIVGLHLPGLEMLTESVTVHVLYLRIIIITTCIYEMNSPII